MLKLAEQVDDRLFHVIAKPALRGVGMAEITPNEPVGKFLAGFVGQIRIAQDPQDIAVNRAAVAIEHFRLSGSIGPFWTATSLEDHAPARQL